MSIADQVKEILIEQLGVDDNEVIPSARLQHDLGADDLDVVELVMELEEKFEIEISDEEGDTFKTVRDIVRYVEHAKKQSS